MTEAGPQRRSRGYRVNGKAGYSYDREPGIAAASHAQKTGSNPTSSGGPAANLHMGWPPTGSETKDEHTVPNPPRAPTLICSVDEPRRSDRIGSQLIQLSVLAGAAATKLGRCRAVRGLSGSLGSCAVTMETPSGSAFAHGWPWPTPRTKIAPCRSARTMLNPRQAPASKLTIAAAASAAVGWSNATSGSSPRLRLPAAGPSVPGRFSTVATTPNRFIPIQVPPAIRSRPATTSGRSGHHVSGGSHGRSTRSSRLAASITKSGRTRTTTEHTGGKMACNAWVG